MSFSQLPQLNARELIRALDRAGFIRDRQKGSHLILIHPLKKLRTTVPMHGGETIKKSLLTEIIAQANLTEKEFLGLL